MRLFPLPVSKFGDSKHAKLEESSFSGRLSLVKSIQFWFTWSNLVVAAATLLCHGLSIEKISPPSCLLLLASCQLPGQFSPNGNGLAQASLTNTTLSSQDDKNTLLCEDFKLFYYLQFFCQSRQSAIAATESFPRIKLSCLRHFDSV